MDLERFMQKKTNYKSYSTHYLLGFMEREK